MLQGLFRGERRRGRAIKSAGRELEHHGWSAGKNDLLPFSGPIPAFTFCHCVLTFAADGAAVGPVSGVQPLVSLEAVRIPQRLSAVAAEEASASVGKHVPSEFWLLGEALSALCAGKWLFSIVDPQVALEVP